MATTGENPNATRETYVLVASDRPLALEALTRPDPDGDPARPTAIPRLDPDAKGTPVARGRGRVLSDDHAPVESLLAPVVRALGSR